MVLDISLLFFLSDLPQLATDIELVVTVPKIDGALISLGAV